MSQGHLEAGWKVGPGPKQRDPPGPGITEAEGKSNEKLLFLKKLILLCQHVPFGSPSVHVCLSTYAASRPSPEMRWRDRGNTVIRGGVL